MKAIVLGALIASACVSTIDLTPAPRGDAALLDALPDAWILDAVDWPPSDADLDAPGTPDAALPDASIDAHP